MKMKLFLPRRHFILWTLAIAVGGVLAGCAPETPTSIAEAPQQTVSQDGNERTQEPMTDIKVPEGKEVATLAAGCFWCTEAIFDDLKGVEKVESGYSGGQVANPSYREVCNGTTGHAEGIQITFDPKVVSYRELLEIFLTTHDPTTLNRQGADTGTQYRSAIFTHNDEQKRVAEEVIREFEEKRIWDNPIVTEVTPFTNFYKAEDYHQEYFATNPNAGYCQVVIAPKVAKFRQKFREKLKR
jgi:peptide-methionine (S)-S-oxide reductase